ncbi:helicase C-terminal domain-containing protein, partial [Piscirickettsia salmonis]|uniref:helicase C-terminal domain-containing protein n=1 Tax=Piscirickettsia salmonis TaxID=1238 RepID=UPI003EB7FEE5
EISTTCIPIESIPSFTDAERRIFMTATLSDDSVLATHFGVKEDLNDPITPETAGDVGDRLILMPQGLNTNICDNDIKQLCKNVSKLHNVVVIVPSKKRANFWKDIAAQVLDKNSIYTGVDDLKTKHLGLTVLVNRYDGIDLPDDACRLLIIDGFPDSRSKIERIKQNQLKGTPKQSHKVAHILEQGMGLGIRSNLDYCAVFLLGRTLTSQLYVGGVLELFSPSTKAQLDLSERVGEQLRGKSSSEFESAIYQFLKRDPKWIKASRGILAGLNYDSLVMTDSVNVAYRKAYDASRHRQPQNAAKILLDEVNRIDSDILKSIVKQEMASYINEYDKVEAQKTQISAIKSNFRLLKPVEGISYKAMNVTNNNQALVISKHFSNKYQDGNNLVIDVEGVLSNLIFAENTANKFEQAINDLAPVIGFIGQRPENDYRRGPDNLWSMPNANFLVIECKNGCTTNHINKRDCNQLNGSKNWFIEEYGTDTNYTPIMIHQSSCFEYAASPSTDIRIIDLELLTKLINNVRSFISSISSNNKFKNTDEVQTYLKSCNLQSTGIIENYTRSYTRKK